VVDAGLEELHLVAMQSKVEKGVPCFWCWSAQEGLYEACLGMLNQRCIAIVFDLDETIIFASNEKKLETHMEEIKSDLKNSELDAVTQLVLQNQLCRVSKDNTFLKDFVHKGAITVDHEIVRNQHEKGMSYKPGGLQLVRPVIRVPKRNAVLTRLNPMVCTICLVVLQITKLLFIILITSSLIAVEKLVHVMLMKISNVI
jgi:RNA polymerase II C-terminal domain phosphatase-like 1/2